MPEKNRDHDILGKVRGTKDQPTDRGTYPDMFEHIQRCLTRDFLTRDICDGSRPDPYETRTSRVTRSVSGWAGSGQEVLKSRGSGRVGSGGFKISRGRSGRVKKSKKSRVGSGSRPAPTRLGFKISRGRSGRVKTSQNFRGSGRVADPPRPAPTREV